MIKRDARKDILEGARYFPVVAILGPRQSGKTTLAQMAFKNHTYVSLEDLDVRSTAINDPRTFLQTNRNDHGLIIDEFQYAPALLSYIQTIVDKEQKPGYFILTGSQNFLMNNAITQSLAGRVSIHTLLPLSIDELDKSDLLPDEIETMLYQGGYPAIYSKQIPPPRLYENYLHTYIERDVRQLTEISNLDTFQIFIRLCAARVGQILNLTSLGNECGISDATVSRWLSILQASYIVFLLHPYHKSFNKRLTKTPKLYFYDVGLASFLMKIKQDEMPTHPNKGNLFESFVISEILKWYYNHGKEPHIYFWRDKTGNEIDCILDEGLKIIPIEIKSARTTNERFFDGLEYWEKITKGKQTNNTFVIFGGTKKQPKSYPNVISWQELGKVFKTIE